MIYYPPHPIFHQFNLLCLTVLSALVSFLRTCTGRATHPLYCLDRSTVHVLEAVRDELTSIHSSKENSCLYWLPVSQSGSASQPWPINGVTHLGAPPIRKSLLNCLMLRKSNLFNPPSRHPHHTSHRDSRCQDFLMFHRDSRCRNFLMFHRDSRCRNFLMFHRDSRCRNFLMFHRDSRCRNILPFHRDYRCRNTLADLFPTHACLTTMSPSTTSTSYRFFGQDDLYGAGVSMKEEQKLRLLDNSERIERTGHHLNAGYRIILETEEIGSQVLQDLHSQRETIQKSRSRGQNLAATPARGIRQRHHPDRRLHELAQHLLALPRWTRCVWKECSETPTTIFIDATPWSLAAYNPEVPAAMIQKLQTPAKINQAEVTAGRLALRLEKMK
uniref:Uncharacterized protein n=1 Tax=Timema bartmani TaxID=61472 RepID=A0A7R9I3Y7_9NEOP|nr:unnamed protein product [Timema bartmani]